LRASATDGFSWQQLALASQSGAFFDRVAVMLARRSLVNKDENLWTFESRDSPV
jgi:hypothetical protein